LAFRGEIVFKKEQKGSEAKADTHHTDQPKDYGIMASPPFGTYSVSFWFFRLSTLLKWLSFFSVFLFWKQFYEGGILQSK